MPTTQDVSCFFENHRLAVQHRVATGGHAPGTLSRASWRDAWPAAALLVAGLIGLAAASLTTAPVRGQYLVVSPPWSSAGQTINLIRSADGGLIEAGRFANIAIAGSADSDFAQRARQAGAWLVVPSPLKSGCLASSTESQDL